jgi:hypothetical protein
MTNQRLRSKDLAAIQYLGLDGITQSCLTALTSLFARENPVTAGALLTCGQSHGFFIWTEFDEIIAIKPGFSSGYAGEGPRGLATALSLLQRHLVEVDEYLVDALFMARLSASCLLQRDIDHVEQVGPLRPRRWYEYVYAYEHVVNLGGNGLSNCYDLSIPFGLIDHRIMDLAIAFRKNPDGSIISAFRRLEDVFRARTGLAGEGTRLFGNGFAGDNPVLRWDVPDLGECRGRAQLFSAAFMAFRNARFHRELQLDMKSALREFLIVNELFCLESEAMTETEIIMKRQSEADEANAFELLYAVRKCGSDE